ncbi:MAG: hypothetical protein QOG25_263 [Acetobacteraceae bacterium]|jgi:hypothetical protein|nr:hypothetical protein [Acetobacteraceae bacterium]
MMSSVDVAEFLDSLAEPVTSSGNPDNRPRHTHSIRCSFAGCCGAPRKNKGALCPPRRSLQIGAASFDHLIGAGEDDLRYGKAKGLGSPEVED